MEKDPDQKDSTLSRRAALRLGTHYLAATVVGGTASPLSGRNARWNQRVFDVRDYGAIGDGKALDTAAIQRTINEAASVARGAQVLIRKGRYLTGTLQFWIRTLRMLPTLVCGVRGIAVREIASPRPHQGSAMQIT